MDHVYRHSGYRPARRVALQFLRQGAFVLLTFVFSVFAGCALTHRQIVTYHTFKYPAPPMNAASRVPATLMVYRFLFSPSLDIHYLTVTEEGGNQKTLGYQRWEQNPADMITDLIQRDLANSGLFEKTVGQYSSVPYRYALEGKILDLRGLVKGGKPVAVLEVEAGLVDFETAPGVDKTILKRLYRVEVPCENSSPEAIIQGLNSALSKLSERLRNDVASALGKGAAPPSQRQISSDVASCKTWVFEA